jgi:hypothetical protein
LDKAVKDNPTPPEEERKVFVKEREEAQGMTHDK